MKQKLSRWEIFCIAMIGVIVLAVMAGFFLPIPKTVDIQMTGYELDADGSIVREGNITIQGVRLQYLFRQDRIRFTNIQILDQKLSEFADEPAKYITPKMLTTNIPYHRIYTMVVDEFQNFYGLTVHIDKNGQWCRIAMTDPFSDTTYRFAASVSGNITDITEQQTTPATTLALDQVTHTLDTTMHAAIVSADGKIADEFDVTLQAAIQVHDTDRDTIHIEVKPLSDFRYTLGSFKDIAYLDHEIAGLPYYFGQAFGFDKVEGFSVPAVYALDVNAEYIIIQWSDYQDYYLVASADPNVSPDTIMDHFAEFLTLYDRSKLWPGD